MIMTRHSSDWVHLFSGDFGRVFFERALSEEGVGSPFSLTDNGDSDLFLSGTSSFTDEPFARVTPDQLSPQGTGPQVLPVVDSKVLDDFEEAELILENGGYAELSRSEVLRRLQMYPAGVDYLRHIQPVGMELALG
ncbi:MAG: hypothetical protein AB7S81_05520 [Bdellovibrionales bacterium]